MVSAGEMSLGIRLALRKSPKQETNVLKRGGLQPAEGGVLHAFLQQ